MHNATLFFDTYALFEIIRGNPKYDPYRHVTAVTSIFNLAELNYGLKKETTTETANNFTEKFSSILVQVTVEDVKNAMSLRLKHKDLSIPDAIGYTIAQRLNIKFLTGDEDFRYIKDVEFVKK